MGIPTPTRSFLLTKHRAVPACRSAAVALLALIVGCAHGTAGRAATLAPGSSATPLPASAATASSLRQLLDGQMAPEAAIPWASGRPLTWSDFQGSPPDGGRESALTAYALYYAWKCRGPTFEFRVVAGFRPHRSWVKRVVLNDTTESRRTLHHEQTHFDIAEVHARRMRRYFATLTTACQRSDAQLEALAQRFVSEEREAQRRYDDETSHGLHRGPQAAWNDRIAGQLAETRADAP